MRGISEQLLNNLLQIGLTVSLAALVPLVLRRVMKKRYPARAVCVVWAILALRLLVPVQLTLPQAPVQVMPRTDYVVSTRTLTEQAGVPLEPSAVQPTLKTQPASVTADSGAAKTVDLTGMLLTLWFAGVAVCAVWQGIGYFGLMRRLKRSARPVGRDDLHTILREQCAALDIAREIPLRVSAEADCPMLAGFVRPTLYLPDEDISRTDAVFIFRHELTHYRHGDLWLKLLLLAARCLHWFNPLVHLIARFAQEDIEMACDDAVVRGQDGAYRRAYGETILRSAIAQSKRRQALVSCFGDDKKTLMRRFEGLFDKSIKKRGVALVVMVAVLIGSLGCVVAVGDRSTPQTTEERALLIANTFAQAYVDEDAEGFYKYLDPSSENAEGDTFSTGAAVYKRYTTRYEPETQTALIVYEYEYDAERMAEQGMQANGITPGLPYREAQRLYFTGSGEDMRISEAIWETSTNPADSVSDDDRLVQSLEEFRRLYENDLGLPDFVAADDTVIVGRDDPTDAAETLLGIRPAASQVQNSDTDAAPYNDIRKVTFTFADNSQVIVTMVNQFGQGWLPQDWTDGEGHSSRTAADLAQQYARGVMHKSAQYIFPILTPDGQQDLISQQTAMTGGEMWTWKYGPSSPTVAEYALVPTDDEQMYNVVFRSLGGTSSDVRSAFTVQAGGTDGRRTIQAVTEVSNDNRTDRELFDLYYRSGLPMPKLEQAFDSLDAESCAAYTDPQQAALWYFGMALRGDSYRILLSGTETVRQYVVSIGDTRIAVVRLNFGDSSTPIEVHMEQTAAGYWQPVGVEENITAESGGQTLGVGADVLDALAAGAPTDLKSGDTIRFTFESEPVGGVQLTNRLVKPEDGTDLYKKVIDEQTVLQKTADGWVYTVPASTGEMLSSTVGDPFYHAVTLEYTDAERVRHTATVVYTSGMDSSDTDGETSVDSVTYHDDTLGCTLKLPQSFLGTVSESREENGDVMFRMDGIADGGAIMTLRVQSADALRKDYGENWTENYPVPVKLLAERDGLAYFLEYVSDVQYDPSDTETAAQYKKLFTAAQDITAEDFTLDDTAQSTK